MKRTLAIFFAALLAAGLCGAPVSADPLLLTADQINPVGLLPPPPADGSAGAKAEMDELHHIQKTRTDAEFAAAMADYKDEDITAFTSVMGPGFDLKALPKTAALFGEVKAEEKAAGKLAKDYFKRNRPWVVDPSLKSCAQTDPPQSSYPSGHATMGYSMAVILASLVPEKAPAIMARAAGYAENRLVCGMHYRRDIVAGEALGTAVAVELMSNEAFKAKFIAARDELRAAQLAAN